MNDDELIALIKPDTASVSAPSSQIRDNLEGLIENGTLQPGMRLPTERVLVEALGVTRVSLRRALESLQVRGLVERRQGSGTYVASPHIEGTLHLLSGFSDELSSSQHAQTTRILQFGFCAPDTPVRDALGVGKDALATVRLVRVRSVDGKPASLETSWLPADIAKDLLGTDLTNTSLFRLLAETKGVVPDHATEKLRATVVDDTEAAELGVAPGTPAFLVNRTTYDANGAPIEYVETLLRGDRYFYANTLEAPHRAPHATERLSQFEALAGEHP